MEFFERYRSVSNEYLNVEIGENLNYPYHMHTSFEAIYMLAGELTLTVNVDGKNEELTLEKDSAILLLSCQVHAYRTEKYSRFILLIFSPDYVDEFRKMMADKYSSSPLFRTSRGSFECLLSVPRTDILRIKSYLYGICADFYAQNEFHDHDTKGTDVLNVITAYVESHYTGHLTLKEIADKYYYNYRYLSTLFNSGIGMNFDRFVSYYRVTHACEQLKNRGVCISDIAYSSGYASVRSFNRNFIAVMQCTPTQYRKRYDT